MKEEHSLRDTVLIESLPENRRSSYRYLCHIKALYNGGEEQDTQEAEPQTWKMARIIDISTQGLALVLQRHLVPGTLLTLAPLIESWNPEWALKVKVTNLRPGPKHSWCAGCAFVEPLTGDQLNVILQNSR